MVLNNTILKSFKNNGIECALDECDYFQLGLLPGRCKEVLDQSQQCALISKESMDLILSFNWYLGKDQYPIGYSKNKRGVKMHKLLMKAPDKHVVDHINRNRLDNRLENLRICTQKENSYNTSKRNGKYKGVKKMKGGWCAQATKDNRRYIIKNIATEKEAAQIYDMIAEELFGEFAGKNFQ